MTLWDAYADEMYKAHKRLKEALPEMDLSRLRTHETKYVMAYSREIPLGAAEIAEATKDASLIQRLISLTDGYGSSYSTLVGDIFRYFGLVAQKTGDAGLLEDLIALFEKNKEDPQLLRSLIDPMHSCCLFSVKGLREMADFFNSYKGECKSVVLGVSSLLKGTDIAEFLLKEYRSIWNSLDRDKFYGHTYEEIGKYLNENQKDARRRKKFIDTVEKEKDFLNGRSSDTVFPLAVIFSEMGADRIKRLASYALKNLSDAWAIARNNPDEIPMVKFYELLKCSLDRGTANRWAKAVVDGYGKEKCDGLRKVLENAA